MTTPDQIANLVAWYEADTLGLANNAAVASWTDASGNSHPATQGSGAQQPIYQTNTLNGLATVNFASASSQRLVTGAFTLNQPTTVFVVGAAQNDSGTYVDGIGGGTRALQRNALNTFRVYAGTIFDHTTVPALSSYVVLHGVFNGASSISGVNGAETTANAGAAAGSGITLGAIGGGTQFLNGNLAEVVIYSRVLTPIERSQIVVYLGAKWGITVLDFTASAALSLQNLTLAGQANTTTVSAALSLQNPTLAGTAVEAIPTTAVLSLQPLTLAGTAAEVLPASAPLSLQPLTLAGQASYETAAAVLGLQNLSLSGVSTAYLLGSAALALQPLSLGGQVAAINRPVKATATVSLAYTATAAEVLPA